MLIDILIPILLFEYEGQKRDLHIGVLFDAAKELATQVCNELVLSGYDARLNEPWAGNVGMGRILNELENKNYKRILAFEFNQKYLSTPGWLDNVVDTLVKIFHKVGLVEP
eukprot:TRINITY_DN3736_c0_g1_i7.p1 TRINITY_DN3736_c0_g1~~TRINITY_DN3736_c0_g1_i7.p1  ORF type:complete len:111 (-),score=8.65 TRINITY_DN3736_c0_g1_i7:102-434(-)